MTMRFLSLAILALCVAGGPALAEQGCGYERAFSVDSGSLHHMGDLLIITVRGKAPGSGWTDARLAAVPEDTGPNKLAYRLIACQPEAEDSNKLSDIAATTYVVAQPGSLHDIIIRAATNELHLHDDE